MATRGLDVATRDIAVHNGNTELAERGIAVAAGGSSVARGGVSVVLSAPNERTTITMQSCADWLLAQSFAVLLVQAAAR
jgi:hypothetical protein